MTRFRTVTAPAFWVLKVVSVLSWRFVARGAEIPVAGLWFVNVGAAPSKMRVPLATVQAPPPDPVRLRWFTEKVPAVRLIVWVPEAGRTRFAMLSVPVGRQLSVY